MADEQETAVHHCFCDFASTLNQDGQLVMPMYTKLMSFLRDCQSDSGDSEAKFTKISTLQKLDPEWLLLFLSSRSDLSAGDIVKCKRQDEDSIVQLLLFECQMPPFLKLPEVCVCVYKEIMWKVLASRTDVCGCRLRYFKADGGLKRATGELTWVKGCYTLIFREGMLVEVQHENGDKVRATHPISSDYTLTDNFNDWAAALPKPSPPPLHSGPLVLRRLAQRSQSGPSGLAQR